MKVGAIDVRERATMLDWIATFDHSHGVDFLFANAGVMEGTPRGGEIEAADAAHALIETNVAGVLNTVQPVLPGMMGRSHGQIGIISSLAVFVPLAESPSYCARKAAVLDYGLSLRSKRCFQATSLSAEAAG